MEVRRRLDVCRRDNCVFVSPYNQYVIMEPVQPVRGRETQATQVTARTPRWKDHDFHIDWVQWTHSPKGIILHVVLLCYSHYYRCLLNVVLSRDVVASIH